MGGDHRERAGGGRRDDDDDDDDDARRRRCGLFKVNADEELLEKGDASDADVAVDAENGGNDAECCLLYTSPSPRDKRQSRMPSSA